MEKQFKTKEEAIDWLKNEATNSQLKQFVDQFKQASQKMIFLSEALGEPVPIDYKRQSDWIMTLLLTINGRIDKQK